MARLAFGPDLAAVSFDNLFTNGQAQTQAGQFAVLFNAVIGLKEVLQIFRGEPGPLIFDIDPQHRF
jgi:hypothetical protein